MALLQPADRPGDVAGNDSHRSVPTPFLTKTYQLVDDSSTDDIISWNDDGSSFVVWNPTVYARDLLPKYFKHNNFSSFVRQLNTYGFKKLAPDRWEFCNEFFRRGERRLLCEIQRRKIAASSPSETVGSALLARPPPTSPSSSGNSICGESCAVEIMDENERLRKENTRLREELGRMKTLCGNIYNLVIKKYNGGGNGPGEEGKESGSEKSSTRLFGVAIGVKREREGGDGEEKLDCSEEEPWMRMRKLHLHHHHHHHHHRHHHNQFQHQLKSIKM